YDCPVPRVSEAHRERRRRQILDAARRCFVRNGFHQTSMQDILGAAGLSAGALYRYFGSKEEIVEAIAAEAVGRVMSLLGPLSEQAPPPPLADAFEHVTTGMAGVAFEGDGIGYIAPQVWAEALRNPRLHALVESRYSEIRAAIATLVRAEQDADRVDPGADPDDVAGFLFGALLGFVLQGAIRGQASPESFTSALAALTRPSQPPAPDRGTDPHPTRS
ncbi:MAG TPA: TetR/AcrR family transcriptional regulator, partial [Jiangellaceae bacterium]|nr:TetR/AcrR family transcriptional regulator [Jiangellaceae bacterium]